MREGSGSPEIAPVGDDSEMQEIRAVAGLIWRERYPSIISPEQVEYRLARMYSMGDLQKYRAQLNTIDDRALLDGKPVGYSACGLDSASSEVNSIALASLPMLAGGASVADSPSAPIIAAGPGCESPLLRTLAAGF